MPYSVAGHTACPDLGERNTTYRNLRWSLVCLNTALLKGNMRAERSTAAPGAGSRAEPSSPKAKLHAQMFPNLKKRRKGGKMN